MPYCPSCGREVQNDNVFCPNCGRNLVQGAPAQPVFQGGIDPDISTAKTLTLAAIVLQLVFFVIGIFIVSFFFPIFGGPSVFPFFAFTIFGFVFAFAFIVSFIWIILDYSLVYKNLDSPTNVPNARTPAIVLGIVQLVLGGTIPGILLILAYVKISDSMSRRGQRY